MAPTGIGAKADSCPMRKIESESGASGDFLLLAFLCGSQTVARIPAARGQSSAFLSMISAFLSAIQALV